MSRGRVMRDRHPRAPWARLHGEGGGGEAGGEAERTSRNGRWRASWIKSWTTACGWGQAVDKAAPHAGSTKPSRFHSAVGRIRCMGPATGYPQHPQAVEGCGSARRLRIAAASGTLARTRIRVDLPWAGRRHDAILSGIRVLGGVRVRAARDRSRSSGHEGGDGYGGREAASAKRRGGGGRPR